MASTNHVKHPTHKISSTTNETIYLPGQKEEKILIPEAPQSTVPNQNINLILIKSSFNI